MPSVNITGYGDDLTVNGIRIGDLSPAGHESIEIKKGGRNYSPLENVVVSHVKDSSTLIVRKPDPVDVKKYIDSTNFEDYGYQIKLIYGVASHEDVGACVIAERFK